MHKLILGITGSGKTHLCKTLAKKYKEAGYGVLVLDPMVDPDWTCDFKTKNKDEFLHVVKTNKNCKLFIDESGQEIGRYNQEMFFLATQARHWGHISHFISQRAQSVNKTVRDQCSELYAFRQSKTDADILAGDFAQEKLKDLCKLKKYEFLKCSNFEEPVLGRL